MIINLFNDENKNKVNNNIIIIIIGNKICTYCTFHNINLNNNHNNM